MAAIQDGKAPANPTTQDIAGKNSLSPSEWNAITRMLIKLLVQLEETKAHSLAENPSR